MVIINVHIQAAQDKSVRSAKIRAQHAIVKEMRKNPNGNKKEKEKEKRAIIFVMCP